MCHRTPEELEQDGHVQLAKEARNGTLVEGSTDFEAAAEQCRFEETQNIIVAE